MNVRLCDIRDREKWIELIRAFMAYKLANEGFGYNADKVDKQFQNTFEAALENPELVTIFIIEENGEMIGFANCMTVFSIWTHGKAFILDDLFLLGDYRGKGSGKAILNYIEAYAINIGHSKLQFKSEFLELFKD